MRVRVVAAAVAVLLSFGSVVNADSAKESLDAAMPGEDDKLYSCTKRSGSALMEVTLKPETELKELVTWVMGFTCKNFVYAPHLVATGRKVTLIAPAKMTNGEAYRLFLAALATMGLTVVPQGNILKIVEAASAKRLPIPMLKGGQPDNSDQIVRYVLRPQFMQADALAKAISSVKSDPGEVVVAGSLLLIADYGSHVREMLSLAKLVDVPSGSEGVYTIPVLHADAAKLAPKITSILGMDAGGGGAPAARGPGPQPAGGPVVGDAQAVTPSRILVDERTNTLVVASSAAGYERVKALVERLDISLDVEGGNAIHVYPLGSAIAEELAKTLNDAIAKTQSNAAAPATGGPARGAGATGPTTGLAEGLEGKAQVVADKPTNKLIIVSSGRDFIALKEVIRELDQPRRQVYIEALILEVTMSNDTTIGTSIHGGKTLGTTGSTVALGGVQTGSLSSANPSSLVSATGLIGGVLGKTLPGSEALFGQSIPSFGVLVQALGNRSNTNILSAPSIIALDNEEAKYKVGTNIPYTKGTLPASAANLTTTVTNIDRKDLVLELSIKPHISTGDQILLEITQQADDLADTSSSLGPSWSTKGFSTRAVVRDQQTFVLGGLMQERDYTTATQVPLLGDIPLLGYLFKSQTKSKRKTNLIIMLTPYIIKDQLELDAIRERKMREHDEYLRSTRSLAEMTYQPRIDYRRKRGLLEEINRSVQQVETDTAALEALRRPDVMRSGAIQAAPATE